MLKKTNKQTNKNKKQKTNKQRCELGDLEKKKKDLQEMDIS